MPAGCYVKAVKQPKETLPQLKIKGSKRPAVRILTRPTSGTKAREDVADPEQRTAQKHQQQSMSMSASLAKWSNVTPTRQNINIGPQAQNENPSQDPLSELKEINMMQSNIHSKMKSRQKLKRLDQIKRASNKFKSPRDLGNLVEANILSLEESLLKQKTCQNNAKESAKLGVLNLVNSDYMKSVIHKNVKS